MSISSSIYIGTSGVIAQQANMSAISNNIANVGTLGYKASRMLFNNLISQQLTGAGSGNQIGQGVGVSSVYQNMDLGPLESTNTSTDIAIGGHGFFLVSPDDSDRTYYTKAGNFRFDQDGYLRDPRGNILQGYKLPPGSLLETQTVVPPAAGAALEDIKLATNADGGAVSEPEATTEMRMMINLDSTSNDRSTSEAGPFTALFDRWDATLPEPLPADSYAYDSSIKIYDSAGNAHLLTVYFDPATQTTDATSGYKTWEYLVTTAPDGDASGLTAKKGILMAGTMTFTPAGDLFNMSAFSGTTDDKASWVPVGLSDNGYPILNAALVGAEPIASAVDFGLRSTGGWNLPAGTLTMADLGNTTADLPSLLDVEKQVLSVTNFNSGSSTIYQSQNGYARGFLQSVSVDTTGNLIGYFSNGQQQGLYKIPLADFINPQGLFREGGNLYTATKDSGAAAIGWAGENRLGLIAPNTLENSNVDLATEFVEMIRTQRAFDANSKAITTGDQVAQTAIQMKK